MDETWIYIFMQLLANQLTNYIAPIYLQRSHCIWHWIDCVGDHELHNFLAKSLKVKEISETFLKMPISNTIKITCLHRRKIDVHKKMNGNRWVKINKKWPIKIIFKTSSIPPINLAQNNPLTHLATILYIKLYSRHIILKAFLLVISTYVI